MSTVSMSMFLSRVTHRNALFAKTNLVAIRTTSTVAGESGRKYTRGKVLQPHRTDPALSVFMANPINEPFVVKRVPRQFYDLSQRLASEFVGSSRLRLHNDCNQEEGVLVFPYFKSTVLALIQDNTELPTEGRKKILRQVDIKPDNVLVNWDSNRKGHETVINAVLGDFDLVFKWGAKPYHTPYAVGNAMWRSPEGQTGRGVTKASNIYSFGLMCIYALGGSEFLLLNDYQELVARGITPEQEILTRHFCYFGPVPNAILGIAGDGDWSAALEGAAKIADEMVKDEPGLRFERWGEELGPEALRMISGMTALDPEARLGIDRVMAHPFWLEDE